MDGRRLIEALLGVYVATLLLPTLAVFGWVAVASASLGSILAAGLAIAAATALAATTIADLPDRVTSLPVVVAAILPPLLFLPYMILARPESTPDVFPVVGLLAVLPGIGVLLAAAEIRNRRLRAQASEYAVVTTGDDADESRFSRRIKLAAAVSIGFVFIAFGASVVAFDGFDGNSTLFTSLTGLSSLFLLFDNDSQELAVTDKGLRVNRSMTPWTDFDSFRVTDEKIKLKRARWWLPTRDFGREEIDDAAVIEAMGEFLPRTDAETEPATATPER
ncbi:hypothetical protein [Halonotius sp. GCM10025705]|uniref:hypothetical protein n=1 Tax=Halonotius sp. GCM10025705 TaxID=3252678 RepID=UPI0036202671